MLKHFIVACLWLPLAVLTCQCSSQQGDEEPVQEENEQGEENAQEGNNLANENSSNTDNSANLGANEFALDSGGSNADLFAADEFNNTVEELVDEAPAEAPAAPPPAAAPAPAPVVVSPAPGTNTAPAAPARGSAEDNLRAFRAHYANVLAGHPEGVYHIAAPQAAIYRGPGQRYAVVGKLKRGDDVHLLKIIGPWAKIAPGKYVLMSALRSHGLKTGGLEAYAPLSGLANP